ncbi:hypothetical protein [Hymenobacter volaticus]|uniref:Uncharacterized protein n=1 Tax=Hymenobacter volaticus TaxID=2932254 RepID=A0ABY4G7F4_9BACT|nr:hypothetical protein [Hymenobacter volaticus]UOQ66816.1 hypothetical protein MUN86_02535 [Hymenobacter volaticus]
MSKHKKENPASNQKVSSPMGPDALNGTPASIDPNMKADASGVQNLNQNHITETGNETKNNTPGGNSNEIRSSRINKPRNSPNPSQQNQK